MAYKIAEARIGLPYLTQIVSCTTTTALNAQGYPVGTIARAEDPTYGQGEFILLPGVASNAVGLVVTYNPVALTTTVGVNTSTYANTPVAVSMAANASTTSLSWYQISGAAVVAKTATKVNPTVALYMSGTAGKVQSTLATGLQIYNLKSINTATIASATGTVNVVMDRPHLQGSKT
jgi:hypothetical protein